MFTQTVSVKTIQQRAPFCVALQSVIPLVDVSLSEAEAAKQVYKACTESGFFYVIGHGLPSELLQEVFSQMRAAFAMPSEAKQAMLVDSNNRGYTPFENQSLDPSRQSKCDTKEGFYFGREVPLDSPEAKLPLHGPNQWPPESLVPGFRPAVTSYFNAAAGLSTRLLRLLGLALGLTGEFFEPFFASPIMLLRPLHYSAEVSHPEEGVFGAGAHTDFGMLTILATDGVPGLQVHLNGRWCDVQPVPGAFIINLGDLLERWTNGVFKSTLHRVVNSTGQERYSLAFFLEPDFHAKVEVLPCCVSADRPAAYPPTTTGEHLLAKLAASHAHMDEVASKEESGAAPAAAVAGS